MKLGRFRAWQGEVEERRPSLLAVMAKCRVVSSKPLVLLGQIEYEAFSDYFDDIPKEAAPPLYVWTINVDEDGAVEIVKAVRQE